MAILGLVATPAGACDEPVYQMAMNAWRPGLFEGYLFHRGPLDAKTREAMDWLDSAAEGQPAEPANLVVRAIDVDADMAAPIAAIWRRQKSPSLPHLVVMPPLAFGVTGDRSVYAGPLDMASAKALIDSPVRQLLARRLRSGEAIVWVLLTGPDAKQNAAARAVLRQGCDEAVQGYIPPDAEPFDTEPFDAEPFDAEPSDIEPPDTEPPDTEPPEPIRYGIVELSRDDPGEAMLRAMLMRSEPDLQAHAGSKPVALPIFGQGRSLTGLVFEQITRDKVLDVCEFLLGPCSCMVSEMAPGVDLLIRTDWSQPAEPVVEQAVAAGAAAQAGSSGMGAVLRNVLIALGVIAAAAVVAALVARTRPQRS